MRMLAPSPISARGDAAPRSFPPASAVLAVAAIAAAWVVVQLVLFGTDRYLGWDEAVYVAEVTPDVAATLDFMPQRARGIVVVAAPIAWAGAGPLRVYLALVSGAALFVGFWPWAQRVGPAAPVAAGIFAFTWGPLILGTELYPNLLAGLAAAAAAGWFVEHLESRSRGALAGAAAGVAAVALLRPSDSIWVAGALAVVAVLVYRRLAVAPIAALAVGGVVGWAPWVVEAFVRFGGPLEGLRLAAERSMGGGDRNNVAQYLNLIEGPLKGVAPDPTVPIAGAFWLLAFAGLVAVGLAQRRRRSWGAPTVAAFLTSMAILGPYLTVTGGINIRYLLPAYALACLPAAVGLAALWAGPTSPSHGARWVLRGVLVVTVGAWAAWQVSLAIANEASLATYRQGLAELAATVAERADGLPCAFASQYAYPSIHVGSGCIGTRLLVDDPGLVTDETPFELDELAQLGWEVYALARAEPPADSPLNEWPGEPLDVAGGGWVMYEHPLSAQRGRQP